MKQYVTKAFYLFLPILILSLTIEVLLTNVPNDYILKREFLDNNSKQIETLILGSSHAFFNLNPDKFDSFTFNAGINSQSLYYDYKILNKYKNVLPNLKTIILPISYPSLWGSIKLKNSSHAITKNYEMYYAIGEEDTDLFYLEILNRPLKTNLKRLFRYFVLDRSPSYSTNNGWGIRLFDSLNKKTIGDGEKIAKGQTFAIHSKERQEVLKQNVKLIRKMIDWTKQNDISILFLTTPCHHSYRDHLNAEQLNFTINFVENLSAQNDHCSYENMLNHSAFKSKDYRDPHHLSVNGANKLSKIINEKVNDIQKSSR
jgi:hypothetical protein